MPEPITTIDLRFSSSPDAAPTPWAETRRVLETAEVFFLATVRADGRPHVTPLAAAWLDGSLYFLTGANGVTQKARNLQRNPRVVLMTAGTHLATGFDVMVEGDATLCADPAVHARIYQIWLVLFGEGWPIELRNGVLCDVKSQEPGLLFGVAPTRIFAYVRGDEWTQTRYQF